MIFKSLDVLYDSLEKCRLCKLCNNPIVPESNPTNNLVVVAERPSKEDLVCNASWFDRQFTYTKSLIAPIFPLESVHFTYLIKCHVDIKTNISNKTSKICRETYLEQEISLIKPKFILTLGKTCGKLLMKEDYGFGEIKKNNNIIIGNWYSPTIILNSGKQKEKHFITFLEKMRKYDDVFIDHN